MATTDTKSGFRLPWSSDRPHDDSRPDESADATTDPAALSADAIHPAASDGSEASGESEPAEEAWPEIDVSARLNLISPDPSTATPTVSPTRTVKEHEAMVDTVSALAPGTVAAPRKHSKLIADLAAAMRATAEISREQSLAQVEAESRQVVEAIRAQSTEGTAALRGRSEEDIVAIRDWSKAEIARVREETERRISERKATLESEIASHAVAIERRVEDVQESVAAYETRMATFFEHLLQESDPARLAAMAESMPEPPSLEIWADLDEPDSMTQASATVGTVDADVEAPGAAVLDQAVAPEATPEVSESAADAVVVDDAPQAAETAVETPDETPVEAEAPASAEVATEAPAAVVVEPVARASGGWGDTDNAWTTGRAEPTAWPSRESTADPIQAPQASPVEAAWGSATADAAVDPAARESILAALEADAEAGVAAEAGAGESSDDAGPDMLADDGSTEEAETPSPEAEASLAARLASLLPGRGSADDEGASTETTATQVIVTGLVSVASIASFKRHLGRLAGVQAVSVASGPDGEFMFNVTHRHDVSFRDVIPTMPGFAARVTGSGDGVVNVTARDPEAES